MRYSWFQLHHCCLGGCHECEMDPFVSECLSFTHLHQKLQRIYVLGLEFYEAVVCPVGVLLVSGFWFFLVEHQQVELVGRTDQVESHVLFAGQSKGEEQPVLLVIKEICEGYSVVELDVCSCFLDGCDGEL